MSTEERGGWMGRSLANYKAVHESTARKNGCLDQLLNATTLTRAKKIVFGEKQKKMGRTCRCGQSKCQRDRSGDHC